MKILLKFKKKEVPVVCREILHLVYHSSFKPEIQSKIMKNFHTYLVRYSIINKEVAELYADHLFVKFQGLFDFNVKHDHNVKIDGVETILKKVGDYFTKLGVSLQQLGFFTKLLWLLYDYFTDVPMSIALLRLATTTSNYIPERVS